MSMIATSHRVALVAALLASACSSSDFEAGHKGPLYRQTTAQPDGTVKDLLTLGAYGWICNYSYLPSIGRSPAGDPCLPPFKSENVRNGSVTTTADSEAGALYNFNILIWPELKTDPSRPEYGAMLLAVSCRREDSVQ